MAFNHYAKLKRIIETEKAGWYIKQINTPTTVQSFSGSKVTFSHYYRLYSANREAIKYGKFQQLDRLAKILDVSISELPLQNASILKK